MDLLINVSVAPLRRARLALTLAAALLAASAAIVGAQTPPSPPAQPAQQQAPAGILFPADAAIVYNQIKPDKTADFEMVIGKLKEALQKSTDPTRKQQAASWKVFKSTAPGPNNTVLYLYVVDPAVKNADYTVSKILAEAFPAEVQELFKKYSDAYAGRTTVNMQLIAALGPP